MNITTFSRKAARIIATLVCVLSIYTVAHAAFDFKSWPVSRPIEGIRSSGMVKIILPTDITWVKGDFSDIRIIDGQGGEVPYLLTRSVTSSAPQTSVQLLNMSSQSDGTTRFIADTGRSGVVRTALTLNASSPNFRRQVSVYASDMLLPLDDSRWSLVTSTGYIFAFTDPYTGYVSGKNTINFPANASRYFKIVVSGGPEGAVSVNGATLTSDVSMEALSYKKERPVSVYNNPSRKTTEVTLDLGSSGSLTDEVTLYTSDANYSRRVIVEATDDRYATSSWRQVGQGSISRVSTSVFQGYSNTVSYPEQRARYIRVSIVNDDNPPLTIQPKADIRGSVLSLIFEAQTGKTYSLYYGNQLARMPNYDIVRLSSYIDEKSLPVVTVGAEMDNPDYVAPAGPVVPYTESHKGLLNGLLVLVVLIIGAGIAVYLRAYMKKNASGGDQGNGQGGGFAGGEQKSDSQKSLVDSQ